MSDKHVHDKQLEAAQAPMQGVGVDAQMASAQRRRRFIKLGAAAVPVSLTLSSRPVMAWHCNTTSAWGSAVLRNGVASVQARAEGAIIQGSECWTIAEWCSNSVHSGAGGGKTPWRCVYDRFYNGVPYSPKTPDQFAKDTLNVGKLFPNGLITQSDTSKNILNLLSNNKGNFTGYVIVARLNALLSNAKVAACLTNQSGAEVAALMAAQGPNLFRPSNSTGAAWTEEQIKTYLYDNWIVRP